MKTAIKFVLMLTVLFLAVGVAKAQVNTFCASNLPCTVTAPWIFNAGSNGGTATLPIGATPLINPIQNWITANTSATTITNFLGGFQSETIHIICGTGDIYTSISSDSTIALAQPFGCNSGGAISISLTLVGTVWTEVGRGAPVTGTGVTLADTQIGFGSSENAVTSDLSLTFNPTTKNLLVPSINNVVQVDGVKYSTPCAAIAGLGSNPGQIWYTPADGAAITCAITLAAHQVLMLGPGVYTDSMPITISGIGAGIEGFASCSESNIVTGNNCPVFLQQANGSNLGVFISLSGSQSFVRNMTIDGNKANNSSTPTIGILVTGNRAEVTDSDTQNFHGDGIYMNGSPAPSGSNGCDGSTTCIAEGANLNHVQSGLNDGNGWEVLNQTDVFAHFSKFEDNGAWGLKATNATVFADEFTDFGGNTLGGATGITTSTNFNVWTALIFNGITIGNNAGPGIFQSGWNGSTIANGATSIQNSSIVNGAGLGTSADLIHFEDVSGVTVSGNTIQCVSMSNCRYGVSIVNNGTTGSTGQIINNIVTGNFTNTNSSALGNNLPLNLGTTADVEFALNNEDGASQSSLTHARLLNNNYLYCTNASATAENCFGLNNANSLEILGDASGDRIDLSPNRTALIGFSSTQGIFPNNWALAWQNATGTVNMTETLNGSNDFVINNGNVGSGIYWQINSATAAWATGAGFFISGLADGCAQIASFKVTSTGTPCGSGGSGAFSGGLGTSYQDVTEIAAPSDPASGNDRLYLNSSTHLLACLTSAGGNCMPSTGSGASSVTNSDGTLTISPTTGAVVASMALGHANTWTATQTFPSASITNAELANDATTVNGVSCVLGSTCTITSSAGTITVGTTTIASGSSGDLLYDNAGILGNEAVSALSFAGSQITSGTISASYLPTATTSALGVMEVGTGLSVSAGTVSVTTPFSYPGAGIPNSTGSAWGTSYSTTGSGNVVLSTSPTLVTPALGTPSAINLANASGLTGALAASAIQGLTGCSTSGYVFTPDGSDCVAQTGGSGANQALSNLSAVSINTSLLAQTGVDLGGTANPFRNVYLFGAGTYGTDYFEITGTPSSTRTWTLQDATDTFVGRATTDTLTNKSISGAEINSSTVGSNYGGTGQAWGSSSGLAQLLSGTFSLYNTNCNTSGVSALNWTVGTGITCNSITSGGPGTGTQYEPAFWATTSTLGSATFGTTPNGVPQFLIEVPSGSALTAPVGAMGGIVVDQQSSTYTIGTNPTDRLGRVTFTGSSPTTWTMPDSVSSTSAVFGAGGALKIANEGTATLTVNRTTTSVFEPSGGTSITVPAGSWVSLTGDNTNWHTDWGFTSNSGGGGSGCTVSGTVNEMIFNNGSSGCSSSSATLTAGGDMAVNSLKLGSPLTTGTITVGNLACMTASNTIGNCTGTPSNNFLGVFTVTTGYYNTSGSVSVTLDGTTNVIYGDILCASSSSAGTAHDNGSIACTNGEWVGIVQTTAASVTTVTTLLRLQ